MVYPTTLSGLSLSPWCGITVHPGPMCWLWHASAGRVDACICVSECIQVRIPGYAWAFQTDRCLGVNLHCICMLPSLCTGLLLRGTQTQSQTPDNNEDIYIEWSPASIYAILGKTFGMGLGAGSQKSNLFFSDQALRACNPPHIR